MLRPIITAVAPAIKLGSMALSLGSNSWLVASDWVLSKGIPPNAFNFAHHLMSLWGLFMFVLSAQVQSEDLLTIDKMLQMLFIVASMVFFELTRQSNPGILKGLEKPVEEHSGRFNLCDSCNIYQPYRSFHCRKCNHCVERFEHHCVWTNSCIGALNLRYLVLLLFTSLFGLFFSVLQSFNALMMTNSLFGQLVLASTASFYAILLYPVTAFFITTMSSVIINVSAAEMRGMLHNSQEYLTMVPYFNGYDFGSDFNLRAMFNGYSIERARWSQPSPLTKLLGSLVAKAAAHGGPGHVHSEACNHAPSPSQTHTQRAPSERATAPTSQTSFSKSNSAETSLSTLRQPASSIVGDNHV
jgi:ribosomal protein L40E